MVRKLELSPVAFVLIVLGALLPAVAVAQAPPYLTQWGSEGSGDGQFRNPRCAAVDLSGDVYVTDGNNNRVQKFSASGTYLLQWGTLGTGDGQFNSPWGVATDAAGNVYVADSFGNRVEKFTSAGGYITQWGSPGSGNGQFNRPLGLAIDGAGDVYVADAFNNRIQKFTGTGVYLTQWSTTNPTGLATDPAGDVYVVDPVLHLILKFTGTGTLIGAWGGYGAGNGQFDQPIGIGADASGTIYVSESPGFPPVGIDRIQAFSGAGAYLYQWGSTGTGNGQFNVPNGIACDAGYVYVVESNGHRVQKFGPGVTGARNATWGRVKSLYR
jgi:tripartite motif-containing protein 71